MEAKSTKSVSFWYPDEMVQAINNESLKSENESTVASVPDVNLNNLNFNYKIVHLPAELAEYIVAHELCHLKELNHSHKFWALVAKAVPDYKARRKKLKAVFV